jgi:hypothetical protein
MDAVEFGELEYDGPPYRGLRTDLDGDGALEYIVESARSLCANGGCVYALFDGATLRPLGSVFGGWLGVRVAPAGAFPIITALSHLSAEAALNRRSSTAATGMSGERPSKSGAPRSSG